MRSAPFVPQDRPLPRVDLIITNGGYNGVQFALANGVSPIAGGMTEAKPEVCARIAWSGVGINLKAATPTPEQVRAAVRTILADGEYRARAGQLAAEIARYDAATAASLLEHMAATGRPVYAMPRAGTSARAVPPRHGERRGTRDGESDRQRAQGDDAIDAVSGEARDRPARSPVRRSRRRRPRRRDCGNDEESEVEGRKSKEGSL